MDLLKNTHGQNRVVVENIQPVVDGGRYAVKAIEGDLFKVSADIFSDSHDYISAFLKYKHQHDEVWSETRLNPSNNDQYEAVFELSKIGFYYYFIEAFIDNAATWLHETRLKIAANQQVDVELIMGAELFEKILKEGANIAEIKKYKKLFTDKEKYQEAINFIQSLDIEHIIKNNPIRQYPSSSIEYKIWTDRKKAGFSAWYSMFPRSAASQPGQHGSFQDVIINVLPKIKSMGFDVLYIPPIHPIGQAFRKGKNNNTSSKPDEPGVPYAIGSAQGGHTAIHPELGTLANLQELIAACQALDIELAMDLAIQCSPDHPWALEHPHWFKIRPDGSIQYAENPPKKYQDIYPINFESEKWRELWLELKHVVQTWAGWGVRIIRVDNPHTKAFGFWEWLINEIHEQYPDMIFLSEAFTRPRVMENLAKLGFSQSYTYYTWRQNKYELQEYLNVLTQSNLAYYFRPNFWPNTHDILPKHLQTGKEAVFLTRHFMAATLSSNYGIYGPVYEYMIHEPVPSKEEYLNSEKYEIAHWDWTAQNKLTQNISKINQIRQQNVALQSTNNLHFCEIENENMLAYLKTDGQNNHILCIVNLDPDFVQSAWVQVPLHILGIAPQAAYLVVDLISGNEYLWKDESNFVELNPHVMPYHLFKINI
jgi:starch synthase (maltosyl-transferring)